jgi:tetratricopeptide (TPR) repeat protein
MIFIAQQAGADLAVMGSYQGPEQNIRISIWVLNLKSLKLGREMNTSGPLAALPQMENELAWMILSNTSLAGGMHREKFREATRKVTNLAYSNYIQGLNASSESEQIRLLEKALQNYPEFPSAHFQIGKLYYQNKDYSKALPHLVQASMIKDLLPQSLFFIGNCYLQENSYNLAIQTFSRNLTISRRADILNNLAVARYRSGDLAASVQDLVDAKNIERTDTTIAINLAILRFLMGNKAAALNAIVECLKYHPENGMLHFLYGYFLKAEGEKDKGMQEMSKANDMGIQVSALQQEKPQMWIRIFPGWIDTRPVSAPSLEH